MTIKNKKFTKKTSLCLISTALAGGLLAGGVAQADSNPFGYEELPSGYMIATKRHKEGRCGEGKCGEMKGKKDDCKKDRKMKEGKCGEGKCGEGKCGEGKCGEGKCGEGKEK